MGAKNPQEETAQYSPRERKRISASAAPAAFPSGPPEIREPAKPSHPRNRQRQLEARQREAAYSRRQLPPDFWKKRTWHASSAGTVRELSAFCALAGGAGAAGIALHGESGDEFSAQIAVMGAKIIRKKQLNISAGTENFPPGAAPAAFPVRPRQNTGTSTPSHPPIVSGSRLGKEGILPPSRFRLILEKNGRGTHHRRDS